MRTARWLTVALGLAVAFAASCGPRDLCQTGKQTSGCEDDLLDAGIDAGADPFDAGVEAPTNPLAFTVFISPDPARLGSNTLSVILKGANGVPVPGATLTAKTWMPTMGHGSTTPVVTENGAGEYTVSAVRFTMYGTWQVTLTATAADGLSGTQILNYTVN